MTSWKRPFTWSLTAQMREAVEHQIWKWLPTWWLTWQSTGPSNKTRKVKLTTFLDSAYQATYQKTYYNWYNKWISTNSGTKSWTTVRASTWLAHKISVRTSLYCSVAKSSPPRTSTSPKGQVRLLSGSQPWSLRRVKLINPKWKKRLHLYPPWATMQRHWQRIFKAKSHFWIRMDSIGGFHQSGSRKSIKTHTCEGRSQNRGLLSQMET